MLSAGKLTGLQNMALLVQKLWAGKKIDKNPFPAILRRLP